MANTGADLFLVKDEAEVEECEGEAGVGWVKVDNGRGPEAISSSSPSL